jgi:hypothetical protein
MFALLRDRLLNIMPPINGYSVAAQAIGLTADHAVHIGQVNSRIDVAAFKAGYPMIATHMVRKPDGSIHPEAFSGVWAQYRSECLSYAETHPWTSEELEDVKAELDALPDRGALQLWDEIRDRDTRNTGFIRRKLHHMVR